MLPVLGVRGWRDSLGDFQQLGIDLQSGSVGGGKIDFKPDLIVVGRDEIDNAALPEKLIGFAHRQNAGMTDRAEHLRNPRVFRPADKQDLATG